MQRKNNLMYSVIIPVHNEEKYITDALNSLISQTVRPNIIIVVDDNSTDNSPKLIKKFIKNYSFIKMVSSDSKSTKHEPGSKIINAFYKGFEEIKSDWDVIVKMDADVILPPNYFETILKGFFENSKIGIAGGLAYIERNGAWVYEKIGNKKQVRGPFKAYSKECFEKIGGLKNSIGWDTADELLAMYHGFNVKVYPDLMVKLQKPTGKDYQNSKGFNTGKAFYKLDYGISISLVAAAKAAGNAGSFQLFKDILKGYQISIKNGESKMVTPEEGKFIRKYRRKGIWKRLIGIS